MPSQHIFNRVVKKLAIAMVLCGALVSCGTVYQLYAPPGANVNSSLPGRYENPDNYRVAVPDQIKYVATKTFSTPSPRRGALVLKTVTVDVEAGDVWTLTHRVKDRLIIFSEAFQKRQVRLSPRESNYLYHLIIDVDGRVNKGWFLLRDPKYVVLASERMTIMDPSIRDTDGWPTEPVFVLQK